MTGGGTGVARRRERGPRPASGPGAASPVIAVVDYGAGNLRSVEFALDRIGVRHRRAGRPAALEDAAGVLLPGVGAAESAMSALEARGLATALRETGRPVLGVCLGLQLLTEASDEGGGEVSCLGRLPGRTRRFRGGLPLPHVGWSSVRTGDDPLFRGLGGETWFYFLHGHRAECDDPHVVARSEYGEPFPAAIRAGGVAGVQFHPEKSGAAGLRVLANFCRRCGA